MQFPFEDPLVWFLHEHQKAVELKVDEPHAMQLATLQANGYPAVRTVLFRGLIRGGLSFYTNYHSQKSRDLDFSNKAGLNFFWPVLQKQVRLEGLVDRLTRPESEAYFKGRPRLSQIGAWASDQSAEIPDFHWLQTRVQDFTKKFEGQEVPCPPHWGGFRLVPSKFEFWFGKEGRLHERFLFERDQASPDGWKKLMKSP